MKIKTAYSVKPDAQDVVADIKEQLGDFDTKLLVFFASSTFPQAELAERVEAAFPCAETFGCSTAGEIVTGKMLTNSFVAMAFNGQAIKNSKVEVLEDLNKESARAFNAFHRYFGKTMAELDPQKYLGIILIDGLSCKEEQIMDKIGDLTDITFIGGSAGDDKKFEKTYVYANGKSYSNAAVLAILEPGVNFSFVKTQSVRELPKKLVVTKANELTREVFEFNSKHAAIAYAEAVGSSVADAPKYFMHNPVGLVFDGEVFVRSPLRMNGDRMIFACSVKEGMELSLLESTDIIASTKKALEEARNERDDISGIVIFNCMLRAVELEQKELVDDYGKLFEAEPTVGINCYGEQFIGHANQTAAMLIFHQS